MADPDVTGSRLPALRRLAVCATLAVVAAGAGSHRDPSELRPGLFLYAAPAQTDPNFAESVVLLIDHGPTGSMGLVVNRETRVPLEEMLGGLEGVRGSGLRLHWGGPVQPEATLALVRTRRPSAGARFVVAPDVHLTGERDDLRTALAAPEPGERLRVYTGYTGWGAGQLANEVRVGAWVLDRADAPSIFAPDTSELWLRVYRILQRLEARSDPSDPPLGADGLLFAVVGPARPRRNTCSSISVTVGIAPVGFAMPLPAMSSAASPSLQALCRRVLPTHGAT